MGVAWLSLSGALPHAVVYLNTWFCFFPVAYADCQTARNAAVVIGDAVGFYFFLLPAKLLFLEAVFIE